MDRQTDLKNTVFMVMPFQDNVAEDAYRQVTKPVVESCGLSILRADEILAPSAIIDDIRAILEQAIIIIVDISGGNPNCFYELGVAHTLKPSRTIMITHDEYKESPFDVAHIRIIKYENTIAGTTRYKNELKGMIESIQSGIPALYADEFGFLVRVFKSTKSEHCLLILQAIALSSRPITDIHPVS